jgi:hypothetical protein
VYFAEPDAVLSPKRRDESLGFGLEVGLLTPYVLAALTPVVDYVASIVLATAREEARPRIEALVRRIFRPRARPAGSPGGPPTPAAPEQADDDARDDDTDDLHPMPLFTFGEQGYSRECEGTSQVRTGYRSFDRQWIDSSRQPSIGGESARPR